MDSIKYICAGTKALSASHREQGDDKRSAPLELFTLHSVKQSYCKVMSVLYVHYKQTAVWSMEMDIIFNLG